jgi:uncharacterized cupin superfamily protein
MGIQKFSEEELLQQPLRDWGPARPLDDADASRISGRKIAVAGCGSSSYGIWEASPGTFVREVRTGEYMHILSGECTFTDDDGVEIVIKKGDTVFFPPDTRGVWRIKTPLRKVYVML